jgi:glycosylphosphatidylinositol transamidase (GPIT) subunit GPI8
MTIATTARVTSNSSKVSPRSHRSRFKKAPSSIEQLQDTSVNPFDIAVKHQANCLIFAFIIVIITSVTPLLGEEGIFYFVSVTEYEINPIRPI